MPNMGYRIDGVPYQDTGCSKAPACLTCPLPVCRHDMNPNAFKSAMVRSTDQGKLAIMRAESLTVSEAAERFGITVRTVWRILSRNRS